jgi:hypothetical protein
MAKCFSCGTQMGSIEGFGSAVCLQCKTNQSIISSNKQNPSNRKEEMEANDFLGGCFFKLAILAIIIYFSYGYIKEWFINPLEYKVKVEIANFRELPSPNAKVIKQLKKGDKFILLSDSSFNNKFKKWGLGINNADTGWLYMELLDQ